VGKGGIERYFQVKIGVFAERIGSAGGGV